MRKKKKKRKICSTAKNYEGGAKLTTQSVSVSAFLDCTPSRLFINLDTEECNFFPFFGPIKLYVLKQLMSLCVSPTQSTSLGRRHSGSCNKDWNTSAVSIVLASAPNPIVSDD